MNKQELKSKIEKLEKGLASKVTPENLKASLKAQKSKFEKELADLEKKEKKDKSAISDKIKALKDKVKSKVSSISRDGARKAKGAGKRIAADGSVYYEKRANRTDSQTKKKPYLEKGGELEGLTANIYRSDYDSPTNKMYGKKSVTVIDKDVPKIFEPSDSAPAVKLVRRKLGFGGKEYEYIHAIPYNQKEQAGMFGGTFIYSSDSRFPAKYPIPLHDRVESYKDGGKIEEIDMEMVESSAKFYTDESKWTTKPTVKKFEGEIEEFELLKKKLDKKEITPSKIIGTGFKAQYARPLAYRWLNERILIAKRAIEILKEKDGKMEKGGYVAVGEKDGYWTIISRPTTKEKAQEMVDLGGFPRGEVGKVVTLKEAKEHKKLIGKEYLEKGGYMAAGGELNLGIRKMAQEEGFTPKELGKEYQLIMGQAVVEALTDANYHSEARKLVSILEKNPKIAEKPNYPNPSDPKFKQKMADIEKEYASEYWDADDKTRRFAIKVSQKSGWDGYAIASAFEYLVRIDGGYHKLADAIEKAMETNEEMANGGKLTNEEYDKLTREYDKLAALAEDAVGEEKEEYKRELEKVAQKIHREERGYAKGGTVKYYDKETEYRIGRPTNYIEKEVLSKVNHDEELFVGAFGWTTSVGKTAEGYLYNLNDFDQKLVSDVKLKQGEKIFRYFNRTTAIGGITPLIKINVDKALLYFPINTENEVVEFETRGVNANYIALIAHKMAKGGGIYSSDSLYYLQVLKDGEEVGREKFRAKNLKEAREIAEDDYEKEYQSKFGDHLSFIISEAMAEGGYTSEYGSARLLGRESQDWESKGREYAGAEWDKLTQSEKDEIISDLQRNWDRNTNFAKGGELSSKLKNYYTNQYPMDELGIEINEKATFNGLYKVLDNKGDVYHYIGVSDSLVRERVFEKLAELKGVKYDIIYQKWLDADEYAKGGETSKNISVFGYDTLNFDICPIAIEEFEKAIVSIEASGNENSKVSLSRAAMYVDDVFGVEKMAKAENMVSKNEFEYAVNQSLVSSAYNYAAGLEVNLFKFMPMHITEIAQRLTHVDESKKSEPTAYDLLLVREKLGDSAFKNMTPAERVNAAKEMKNTFEEGGTIEDSNYRMVVSQAKAVKHHADELLDALEPNTPVEAWVVGKIERASTDMADITHYIDGLKMEKGGYMDKGGKIYSISKNNNPYDWGLYTKEEAQKIIDKEEKDGSFYSIIKYNDMRDSLPAIERMNTPTLDEIKGKFTFNDSKPFSQGDLYEYKQGGYMAKGGELANGVYYLGKPKKQGIVWSQTVVDISDDSIDFAKDYARKIKDFNATGKKKLSHEEFAKFLKEDKRGEKLSPEFEKWESYARGGMIVGRWYKDNKGIEHRYIGEDNSGQPLFSDGEKVSAKSLDDFESDTKETKLFKWFKEGGKTDKKYTVNVYYGGEMDDEIFETDSLDEAKKLSQQGEHSEIYDNSQKQFVEIEYSKGGLTKQDTLKVAQKFAKAISKADNAKVTVNMNTLEEDSFDLDADGIEYDGGSYNIYPNGDVKNMALSGSPVYGKTTSSVEEIVENLSKMAKGGETNYTKKWRVVYITLQGKRGTKEITLGRMSDQQDVKNALRRMPDLNIREVTLIEEMAMGGKVKFEDKVKAIKASLLKKKKVSKKVQKDYGKTYNAKEAEQAAKRIAGAMRKKEMK